VTERSLWADIFLALALHGEYSLTANETEVAHFTSCGGFGDFLCKFPDGEQFFSSEYAEEQYNNPISLSTARDMVDNIDLSQAIVSIPKAPNVSAGSMRTLLYKLLADYQNE